MLANERITPAEKNNRCSVYKTLAFTQEVYRTTFARQAANLWKVKENLWQELLLLAPHDPAFALVD